MKKTVIILLILAMLPLGVFAAFENTHVNTGNGVDDILAVAFTQEGYMEGSLEGTVQGSNDCTKYGEWYGLNYHAWCAMFVSWCADQAGIPTTVIPKHASCDEGMNWFINRGKFQFAPYYGGTYEPKRGDIVYFGAAYNSGNGYDSTHVGIVYMVDDTRIHVIEGNSSKKVQTVSYKKDIAYVLGYGVPDYSGESAKREPGVYITTASSLNVRSEPTKSSASLGQLAYGSEVEVTEVANEIWGKIAYNGKTGWISLDYCTMGYTVKYNTNGGSNAPQTQIKSIYADLVITSSKPARTGYTFTGWSTSADGEVVYKAGDRYTENKSIVLYAQWKVNTYTVTLDANGGTPATATLTKEHGKALSLEGSVPVLDGYKLVGWSSTKNGEPEYTSVYDGNKDITLYAVWERDRDVFTVTYNANGGENPPAAEKFTEGMSITITDKAPVRQGYTFEGWAYSGNVKWASVFAGDVYNKNASLTLYAVWSKETPDLTLIPGEGGRIQKYMSDDTLGVRILADSKNSISYISIDDKPIGIPGDLSEYVIELDTGKHTVTAEFTYNGGLWINPFSDVISKAWYYDAIEYCYLNNIMTGVDATHFAPNATVTRAQFVTLLGRLHGAAGITGDLPFSDVSSSHYYYEYLIWAYNSKIISGTSEDKFSPNAPITREQLCVILYNYEKYKGTHGNFNDKSLVDFSDNQSISSWAREAMAWAVYSKVISGSDGKLLPRNYATRAQAAVIIKNHTS
ncbi:MAG: InlB B-repeat-containing protein [Clostridia bacterium]|nr:InlB B-repeat-containing protein [Clostridia bacterium]